MYSCDTTRMAKRAPRKVRIHNEVVCLVSMVPGECPPWEAGKAVQHGCFFWLLDHGLWLPGSRSSKIYSANLLKFRTLTQTEMQAFYPHKAIAHLNCLMWIEFWRIVTVLLKFRTLTSPKCVIALCGQKAWTLTHSSLRSAFSYFVNYSCWLELKIFTTHIFPYWPYVSPA